jgi:hypothetical protein
LSCLESQDPEILRLTIFSVTMTHGDPRSWRTSPSINTLRFLKKGQTKTPEIGLQSIHEKKQNQTVTMSNTHPYSGASPIPKVADFLREQRERFPEAEQQTQELTAQAQQREQGGDDGGGARTTKAEAHPSPKDQTKALQAGSKEGNRRTVKDPTTGNEVVIEDVNANFKKAVEDQTVVVPKTSVPGQQQVSVGLFCCVWCNKVAG